MFEVARGELEAKNCLKKQPRIKIWEKLYIPCEIAYYGKGSISIFKKCLASIDKIFVLGGSLGSRLYFHEVLTLFWALMISEDSKSWVVRQLLR